MSSCKEKPFEVGFSAAWNGLLEKLEFIRLPDVCPSCSARPYCFVCPGVLEAETGSAETTAAWLCAKARAQQERVEMKGEVDYEEDVRSPDDEGLCA